MFIKKLYHYNKILFCVLVGYILLFVFINYKSGLVVSPIIQYGMYSGVYKTTDTIKLYKIYANDSLVDFSKLPIAQRDILETSLDLFKTEKSNNLAVFETMKRVLSKMQVGKLMQAEQYTNNITPEKFKAWYMMQLSKIMGYTVTNVKIDFQTFVWKDNKYAQIDSLVFIR
jgi:hypothetical protein